MCDDESQFRKKQPNSKNCFVCGLENKLGLQLTFYQTKPGEVVVETKVPDQFQGYPKIVHGGIVASLVDEVLGRVHMGDDPQNSRFMYTTKLTLKYRKPVMTNTPIKVVGQAIRSKTQTAISTAKIIDNEGNLLIEAEGILRNVPEGTFKAVDLDNLGWKVYPD
jgi:uncharacterized protein (TIGR00369 family)